MKENQRWTPKCVLKQLRLFIWLHCRYIFWSDFYRIPIACFVWRFSRRNHIGTGCFHISLWWVSACWKPHHPLHSSRFSWLLNLWGGFQEGGRRALWAVNGPRILQVGYEDEEDPKVMEAYERVGALVISCSHLSQSFLFLAVWLWSCVCCLGISSFSLYLHAYSNFLGQLRVGKQWLYI